MEIPEGAEKWLKPVKAYLPQQSLWVAQNAPRPMKVEFPGDMSETDIMREFATVLIPRPTFSLATALRSHVLSLSVGLALFASGLFCCVRLLRNGRKTHQDSVQGIT